VSLPRERFGTSLSPNRLANATADWPRPPCVRAASPHHRKLGAGYAALPQWLDGVSDVILDPLWRSRTTGIQNDRRLPGTTSPRVRSPWLAAIVFSEKVVINECDIAVIPDETQALDYTVLREGNYGQYTITRVLEVFADQDSFEHAFDLSGAETNPPTAPLVDFTKNRVIGLFMWENGSVGYHHIRTTSVTQNGVAIVFNVELTKPKPGCPSDNALSQPFQFVSIEKLSLPIIFSESLTELGCN